MVANGMGVVKAGSFGNDERLRSKKIAYCRLNKAITHLVL
jgi:hypothetical protein